MVVILKEIPSGETTSIEKTMPGLQYIFLQYLSV